MHAKSSFTQSDILGQLYNLGIRRGDRLAFHSSYKALGAVAGGPETVIKALLEALGDKGTLLMPIFVDHPVELYDPRATRSDCGIITELFRRRADVKYSYHPTHAVAVWGQDAEWIAGAHAEGRTALGVDSPFDRLAQSGGKVLLAGVGHTRNSMVHVGEAYSNAPYLNVFFSREFEGQHKVRMEDGGIKSIIIHECPGCSDKFGLIENILKARGMIKDGYVCNASSQLMNGTDIIACVRELLTHDPGALLCDNPDCGVCPRAKETISAKTAK